MRKRIYILAAVVVMAAAAACGPRNNGAGSTQPAAGETVESGAEDGAAAGTESGADKDISDGATANGAESGKPESSAPEPSAGEAPGEAQDITSDEKLKMVYHAVKDAYGEDYIPDMAYDETALEEIFGVKKDWYDTFVADGPAISVHVESFIGIKAVEGKAEDVKKALENYREEQLSSSMQYPMNVVKFEASQVVSHGDYVFFVMLGSPSMESEEEGEEAALASAKENNAAAIDAIEACFKK